MKSTIKALKLIKDALLKLISSKRIKTKLKIKKAEVYLKYLIILKKKMYKLQE